ncbi:hypothetical protein PV343_33955 [Streptomyces sp. WI03-4A]|nr:hypothetical protein [Streptomyces sp. WI03-4A]MDX2597220.1 hypothetical protein [Streptomyces sp. WI03-4A]
MVHGTGMPMFATGLDIQESGPDSVRQFGNGALVRTYSGKR